jgi:uncharacterized RDD family membrane protein YckC
MDAHYTVDTPENVTFAYDVAGIGSRFLAAIVDTLLILLIQVVIFTLFFIVLTQVDLFDTGGAVTSIITAILVLLSFVFLWGYYILFELIWSGQTPGKRTVGLRVVREGGRPITFVSSAIRNLIRVIDFLPGFYGLGVMVMFIDQRARRLGDLAAGTLVVKERGTVSLESLTRQADPLPTAQPEHGEPVQLQLPNLHLITEKDYTLVQEFLRRRSELGRDSRIRLGTQLAENLRARMGIPSDSYHEPFLEYLVYEYRISRRQEAL